MTQIAIPALLYLDVDTHGGKDAVAQGEEVRRAFDTEVGLPNLVRGIAIRPDLDHPVRVVEGYRTPVGESRYEVTLRLTVEDEADWPEDDAQPGDYEFSVGARNLFEAVERAKDEFAEEYPIKVLDDAWIEAVGVKRVEPRPSE